MGNKAFFGLLLEITELYEKNEKEKMYKILDRAIMCNEFLRGKYDDDQLDDEETILYKIKEAVDKNPDPKKLRKFITEIIFM